MKAFRAFSIASPAAAIALWLALSGFTQEQSAHGRGIEKTREAVQLAAAASVPVYTPPKRGAPGGRIGGGSRGIQRDGFSLAVLAPDHTGLTSMAQPTLYWFVSSDLASTSVELTVMDPQGIQPLLEIRLPPPLKTGVHSFRLADHGVRLSPAVPYRWFVALVMDPDRRSKDILAGGFIELVPMPAGLGQKIASANKDELPRLYAEAGLWYDAIAAISQLVEAAPGNDALRRQRTALLEQAGLIEVAKLLQ